MKKMSLQWRLTIITALLIAGICMLLNFLMYRSGIYSIDSLQDVVIDLSNGADALYIDIPQEQWDDFAAKFSGEVYVTKESYRRRSLLITLIITLAGGAVTYFVSGRALKPLRDFSSQVEKVQAQNMTECIVDGGHFSELEKLSTSYNKMLLRLAEAFEVQRQFTGNAAHELRTPLSVMQVQLDLYHASKHPENNEDAVETIKMITEQNERLSKLVKTLLDMSELQRVERSDEIELKPLMEEIFTDLEPLASEKEIELTEVCEELTITGSDILLYRMLYNLVENAIKYNHCGGKVEVSAEKKDKTIVMTIKDTGTGIPKDSCERVFEPFFRVDKSRSRESGGVGLGLALVQEIVRLHEGKIAIKESSPNGTVFEVILPEGLHKIHTKN